MATRRSRDNTLPVVPLALDPDDDASSALETEVRAGMPFWEESRNRGWKGRGKDSKALRGVQALHLYRQVRPLVRPEDVLKLYNPDGTRVHYALAMQDMPAFQYLVTHTSARQAEDLGMLIYTTFMDDWGQYCYPGSVLSFDAVMATIKALAFTASEVLGATPVA